MNESRRKRLAKADAAVSIVASAPSAAAAPSPTAPTDAPVVEHDPRLTFMETQLCRQLGARPEELIAVPVEVVADGSRRTELRRVAGPTGTPIDVIVVPMLLAIPTAHVRMTRILTSSGEPQHPLAGMLPNAFCRVVVPRERLQRHVIDELETRIAADQADR